MYAACSRCLANSMLTALQWTIPTLAVMVLITINVLCEFCLVFVYVLSSWKPEFSKEHLVFLERLLTFLSDVIPIVEGLV